jgi:hypothetical protein
LKATHCDWGVAALGNGQAKLALVALALHVSVDLIERNWWRASALLTFGVGLKLGDAGLGGREQSQARELSWIAACVD